MDQKKIKHYQLIFRNETITMCNKCNIELEKCSIQKASYITEQSWSDSGFRCDGCDDLFGSFVCPNVSCKQLFHKRSNLLFHEKAYHTWTHQEKENQPKQESKSKRGPIPKEGHYFEAKTTEETDRFTPSIVEKNLIAPATFRRVFIAADITSDDLKAKLDSMMKRSDDGDNNWKCTICGKTFKATRDMRRHIESHIDGLSYPCTRCNTVTTTSVALLKHVAKSHKKEAVCI